MPWCARRCPRREPRPRRHHDPLSTCYRSRFVAHHGDDGAVRPVSVRKPKATTEPPPRPTATATSASLAVMADAAPGDAAEPKTGTPVCRRSFSCIARHAAAAPSVLRRDQPDAVAPLDENEAVAQRKLRDRGDRRGPYPHGRQSGLLSRHIVSEPCAARGHAPPNSRPPHGLTTPARQTPRSSAP